MIAPIVVVSGRSKYTICLLLIALVATGCSRAVEIPRDHWAEAPEAHPGYRIQMMDGTHYSAKRYSTTDSTLVIEKLNPSDSRYKKVTVPTVLSMSNVKSVSSYEMRAGLSFALVATVGVFAILMINLVNNPITLGN